MSDDWTPKPAELRDAEDSELSAHARGTLAQLVEGARSGEIDIAVAERYRRAALADARGDDE